MQIPWLGSPIKKHKWSKPGPDYFFSSGKLNAKTAVYSA
jgi:hypothetical protein